MKKWTHVVAVFSAIIFWGVSFGSIHAAAETGTQMTALEKKLYEAARKEGKLVYWDSLSLRDASLFFEAFKKRFPGIDISYWQGDSAHTDDKYFAESAAGRQSVDVMQIDWYDKYKEEGRLVDLGDIIKDTGFPREFSTKGFDAVAIEHSVKGTAYNTKLSLFNTTFC